MAFRAIDVLRCKNCNAGARFIVLPTANKPQEAPLLYRDGTINGKAAECPIRADNHCTPPDAVAFDPNLSNDGATLGEVQILAAMTGLKFDAECQKVIRDATVGCMFCVIGLGRAILACAEPLIAKGDDFVIEPDWLQKDVYEYVRGHSNTLHNEAHTHVFGKRQNRKSLKKPQPRAEKKHSPPPKKKREKAHVEKLGKSRKCISCGQLVEEKRFDRHARRCVDHVYSCIFCPKYGLVERGLRLHLLSCKGKQRPANILADTKALRDLVREMKTGQDKLRMQLHAKAVEQYSKNIRDDKLDARRE